MRFGQYSGRLRRLEGHAAEKSAAREEITASGRIPVTLFQIAGVAPMTADDCERLRQWMLEHGWTEDEDGNLVDPPPRS